MGINTITVTEQTDLTSKPASRKAFAVPPEAMSLKPSRDRSLAKSSSPVLSDTLNNAEKEEKKSVIMMNGINKNN